MFWRNSPYPAILLPDRRVLPGRPKRCRTKDAAERREEAEKQASKKGEQADTRFFKASGKGAVIHWKICGGVVHNARTCRRKQMDGNQAPSKNKKKKTSASSSQPASASSKSKKKKNGSSSSQPATSTREEADLY
ncbi:hypothetical protein LIER_34183 [Lithospermum erythrorhizon]|uniref:Uncharacterized protein n=1 Tax=Lithospermum erythrorhizon TaxID=34254 RepID=A0AAV3S175_LITER